MHIVFDTQNDNGISDAVKRPNDKFPLFLYKTMYIECQYLKYFFIYVILKTNFGIIYIL